VGVIVCHSRVGAWALCESGGAVVLARQHSTPDLMRLQPSAKRQEMSDFKLPDLSGQAKTFTLPRTFVAARE
jgi:hypothetical protein